MYKSISRRAFGSVFMAAASLPLLTRFSNAAVTPTIVKAYRNPGCGCCEKWSGLMKDAGFAITMEDDLNLADRKALLGVPANIAGCHTAMIGQYIIEGHVPPADVIKFLSENSMALGLAVPGMPAESPGMEAGGTAEKYDVMVFSKDGKTSIYASH